MVWAKSCLENQFLVSTWKEYRIGYIPKIHDAHRAIVENPQEKRPVRSTIGEFLASDESMLNR